MAAHLSSTRILSEVDGVPIGEESEVVEKCKNLTAGLVKGGDHGPPILGKILQCLHHTVS